MDIFWTVILPVGTGIGLAHALLAGHRAKVARPDRLTVPLGAGRKAWLEWNGACYLGKVDVEVISRFDGTATTLLFRDARTQNLLGQSHLQGVNPDAELSAMRAWGAEYAAQLHERVRSLITGEFTVIRIVSARRPTIWQ